ncbi:Cellular tumor antigen p53 [Frankliniella fusca]|uniref:Cellular tumor antigen p53 n=1 Tax=Frankliniella fusca TaxID=407009 RepID=A0AAE1HMA0_9NEOP|nr:Cellular tumor antigen p53 [Frankliniella fusca]
MANPTPSRPVDEWTSAQRRMAGGGVNGYTARGEPVFDHLVNTAHEWANVPVPVPGSAVDPTGELPARNEWAGIHFFDVKVDLSGLHKKYYVYSSKLNKLFVDMDKVVPFQIKWDGHPGLYVRAMMMFCVAEHLKQPVRRCLTHKHTDDPSNFNYEHSEHVLATENDNCKYEVNPNSLRHSVKVPLSLQHGCDHTLINYKFMCKTSCTGGLNRSPTDIIFTLENEVGEVFGRQIIGVKICSCPKRDKEKEETNLAEPSGKTKIKRKKEEKPSKLMDPPKKIKQELFESSPYSSFMVTAANPQIAQLLKEHIKKWEEVKSVEWNAERISISPLVEIIDNVAVLPQPYQ